MTPICMCASPEVVKEDRPGTAHHGPYTVTYCRRCGYHYDVKYGSRPLAALTETRP